MRAPLVLVLFLGVMAVGCPDDHGPSNVTSWAAVADPVVAELDSLVAAVEKGDREAALASYDRAYWTLYDKDLEVACRSHLTEMDGGRQVNAAVLREEQFGEVKNYVSRGAPAPKVLAKVRELQAKIREDARKLDDMKVR